MENKLHHGYLLAGDIEKALEKALEMSADVLGVQRKDVLAHPDFCLVDEPKFLIKNARQTKENSAKKSFYGKGRVFVIKSNYFNGEACNALLKTFEEPQGKSYFFVVTSSEENILDTLRSRLVVLNFGKESELPEKKKDFVERFLEADVTKRADLVKDFLADKERVFNFLDGLEIVLREKMLAGVRKETVNSLSELLKQRSFLAQRASQPKMIIEYICLTLPKIL